MSHDMDLDSQVPPSLPLPCIQPSCADHLSFPLAIVSGPSHVLPSYPSSALNHYYPSTFSPVLNFAHILTLVGTLSLYSHRNEFHSCLPLPSASQSHPSLLRQTPSTISLPHNQRIMNDNDFSDQSIPLSPLAFAKPIFAHVLHNNPICYDSFSLVLTISLLSPA